MLEVVRISVPLPALHVALAVTVKACDDTVAEIPLTTAVPLIVAVNVS